jgi:acyl-CoA thioester hydrolase
VLGQVLAVTERRLPSGRDRFRVFTPIMPRWNDIDVFGHVNNAEFYAYFDTAALRHLHGIEAIQALGGAFAALVVESGARFYRPVLFTDQVTVGLSIARIGNSSVRYRLGVFTNDDPLASVEGEFVHVFVDRETRRPVPIPDKLRSAFASIEVPARDAEASD